MQKNKKSLINFIKNKRKKLIYSTFLMTKICIFNDSALYHDLTVKLQLSSDRQFIIISKLFWLKTRDY